MITRRGIAVAVGAVLAYTAGLLLGYEELFVFTGAALVALLAGFGWILMRPSLAVSRSIEPQRVQRGDPAIGAVRVTNRSRYPSVAATAEEPCGPVTIGVTIPRLAPGASITRRYRLPTDRRAVIDIGPIVITRADPLRLWRTERRQGSVERLWVHPVVHPLVGLPAGRTRSLEGRSKDTVPHGSVTFHALREYVIGDDLRHVHWKASAHVNQLMVREHVDTSLPEITVLLDTRAQAFEPGEFEEAVEATASVAVAATRAGYPVRLVTTCGRAAGGRGIGADAGPLLDLLAEVELAPGLDLREVVRSLAHERRGDTFIAITGRVDSADFMPVASLSRRYDDAVIALVCADADTRSVAAGTRALVVRAPDSAEFARHWNLQVAV